MLKNIIIAILTFMVVLFWLSEEPDDVSSDLDDVVIEYRCSELDEYEKVPEEVIDECKARGLLVKNTI